MALDLALKHLIEQKLSHAVKPQWEMPIEEVREACRKLWTPAITGDPVPIGRVADLLLPGSGAPLRARLYATGVAPRPVMLYFHGGGYVKGGIEESDAFCRNLARVTGHIVLSVDYRLAPEHRFPAAHDDAVAATVWAAEHTVELGATAGPVVVCGESAGGNLAALTCLRLRGDPRVTIRLQVLLQPVIDFTLSFPSIAMPATECLVPRDDLAWYYATYLDGRCPPADASVSPIRSRDLSGLPPALIIAAEYDTLRDEAQAYAVRLREAGTAARYVCADGMVHGFLQMRGLVAGAQAATEEIARAVQ